MLMTLQPPMDDIHTQQPDMDETSDTMETVESETEVIAQHIMVNITASIEGVRPGADGPSSAWHDYCDGTLVLHGHNDSFCEVQHLFGAHPGVLDAYFEGLRNAPFW